MEKITELSSLYRHLEKTSVDEPVNNINNEDKKVALAIEKIFHLRKVYKVIFYIIN